MNEHKVICAELLVLLCRQFKALELGASIGLTDAEWDEYDFRRDRIRVFRAKLEEFKQFKAAA